MHTRHNYNSKLIGVDNFCNKMSTLDCFEREEKVVSTWISSEFIALVRIMMDSFKCDFNCCCKIASYSRYESDFQSNLDDNWIHEIIFFLTVEELKFICRDIWIASYIKVVNCNCIFWYWQSEFIHWFIHLFINETAKWINFFSLEAFALFCIDCNISNFI